MDNRNINQIHFIPFYSGLSLTGLSVGEKKEVSKEISEKLNAYSSVDFDGLEEATDVITAKRISEDAFVVIYTNGTAVCVIIYVGNGLPSFGDSENYDDYTKIQLLKETEIPNDVLKLNYQKKITQDLLMIYPDHPLVKSMIEKIIEFRNKCLSIKLKTEDYSEVFVPHQTLLNSRKLELNFVHTMYVSDNSIKDNALHFLMNSKKLGDVTNRASWSHTIELLKDYDKKLSSDKIYDFHDEKNTTFYCNWGRSFLKTETLLDMDNILEDEKSVKVINNLASVISKLFNADISLDDVDVPLDKPSRLREYYNRTNIEYLRAKNNSFSNTEIGDKYLLDILIQCNELESKYEILLAEILVKVEMAEAAEEQRQNNARRSQNYFLAIVAVASTTVTFVDLVQEFSFLKLTFLLLVFGATMSYTSYINKNNLS